MKWSLAKVRLVNQMYPMPSLAYSATVIQSPQKSNVGMVV